MSQFTWYCRSMPLPPERRGIAILVFKTNIRNILHFKALESVFDGLEGLRRWNVDREDIDNVLRIETTHPDAEGIIRLVRGAGLFCEELPD